MFGNDVMQESKIASQKGLVEAAYDWTFWGGEHQ
jgi:hypothetical protein